MTALLVSLLVLAAAAPQPLTQNPAPISRAQDSEGLAAMEHELNLTGEELARFCEKADAERAALDAWANGESGQQFAALARERAAAAQANHLDRAKALWEQMRPLSAERLQIHRQKRSDVLATLTPGHLRQWAGHVLFTRVETDLSRIALADQQRRQIREIANAHAAPAVDAQVIQDDPFLRSLHRLRPGVIAEARERVLSPEQIETLRSQRVAATTTTRPGKAEPVEKE